MSEQHTKNQPMNEFPLLDPSEEVPLFYPFVPKEAIAEVTDTLSGRWIGQGPKVDRFEKAKGRPQGQTTLPVPGFLLLWSTRAA